MNALHEHPASTHMKEQTPPPITYGDLIPSHYFFQDPSIENAEGLLSGRIFKPRANATPSHITFPVDWSGKEFGADRNTKMHLHGWTMLRPALTCFDTSDTQTQQDILSFFLDIMHDWHRCYGADADNIVTTRMPKDYAWYDMSTGFRAVIISFFRNRITHFKPNISAQDTHILEELAQKHIRHLSNSDVLSLNNHGIWQMHGLVALIMTSQKPNDYICAYTAALNGMYRLASAQFDSRGVHTEHSPHYHFYALNIFRNIFASGWYGKDSAAAVILDRAAGVTPWLVDPLRRPACIGDSVMSVQGSLKFPEDDLEQSPAHIRSDFDTSGYHIIRSAWGKPPARASYMFFMAAFHAKTHKHRDCLSFEWFEAGRKIICDSGKYAYASDAYRHYCLSSRAHNSVDIEGFDILKIAPYGSAITSSGQLSTTIFTIEAELNYPAIRFHRTIYYCPRRWMIIKDRLSFKRGRSFTQWFHTEKDYQLISNNNNRIEFCHSDDKKSLIIRCLTPGVNNRLFHGDETETQGFVSEKDYNIVPNYAVGFDNEGKKGEFVTLLSLSESDEQHALHAARAHAITDVPKDLLLGKEEMLPGIPLVDFPIKNGQISPKLRSGKTVYAINDGIPGDFFMYSHIKPGTTNTLTVLLPGAVNREHRDIDLQRYSWSDDIEGHVVSLSDPTITIDNTLSIGWFQGTREHYAIDRAHQLIDHLCNSLDIAPENLYIFGSSAGGFSALQLGSRLPHATIGAVNPQIILKNYSKRYVDAMLDHCYPQTTIEDIVKELPERMQVHIHKAQREAPAFVFQNIADVKHHVFHIGEYLKQQDPSSYVEHKHRIDDNVEQQPDALFNVVYYNDPDTGHAPPKKDTTLSIVADIKQRSKALRNA